MNLLSWVWDLLYLVEQASRDLIIEQSLPQNCSSTGDNFQNKIASMLPSGSLVATKHSSIFLSVPAAVPCEDFWCASTRKKIPQVINFSHDCCWQRYFLLSSLPTIMKWLDNGVSAIKQFVNLSFLTYLYLSTFLNLTSLLLLLDLIRFLEVLFVALKIILQILFNLSFLCS